MQSYFSTSTQLGKEETKKVSKLLQTLIESQDSYEFRQPVDWKTHGLLDYPVTIKKPMDLGTIKSNLAVPNFYRSVEQVLEVIHLVWANCKTYNSKEVWIYGLANKLETTTRKLVKNYLPGIFYQT